MIYRKDEFVQNETGDAEFPIKQIDRMEPLDGEDCHYIGRGVLNMRTPMGIQQIPVSFEIEAASVEEAFERYAECARPKMEETREHIMEQLRRMRDAEENRIVTPQDIARGDGGIIDFGDFVSDT